MTASLQSQRSDSDTSALYNDFVSCTIISILLTTDNVPVSDYKYRITWFIQQTQYFWMFNCLYCSAAINEP